MIVLDTSALYAALVETETQHDRALRALQREEPPFVLSPFVLCELDYLLVAGVGTATELEFLTDVAAGAYLLASFTEEDVAAAAAVIGRYDDHDIGLADASIVVLADRYETDRVLTLDERHFRALQTLDGRPFMLLPADA